MVVETPENIIPEKHSEESPVPSFVKWIFGGITIFIILAVVFYKRKMIYSKEETIEDEKETDHFAHLTHNLFIGFKLLIGLFLVFLAYTWPFVSKSGAPFNWSLFIPCIVLFAISAILLVILFYSYNKSKDKTNFWTVGYNKIWLSVALLLFILSISLASAYGDGGLMKSDPWKMIAECVIFGISTGLGVCVLFISRSISAKKSINWKDLFLYKFLPFFFLGFVGDIISENSGFNTLGFDKDPDMKFVPAGTLTYFVYFVISCVAILLIMSLFSKHKYKSLKEGTGFSDMFPSRVKDSNFFKKTLGTNLFQLVIEGIILGCIGAAPLFLMQDNRQHLNDNKELQIVTIEHFAELTGKILLCHLILQFTGVYANILDVGDGNGSEIEMKGEKIL